MKFEHTSFSLLISWDREVHRTLWTEWQRRGDYSHSELATAWSWIHSMTSPGHLSRGCVLTDQWHCSGTGSARCSEHGSTTRLPAIKNTQNSGNMITRNSIPLQMIWWLLGQKKLHSTRDLIEPNTLFHLTYHSKVHLLLEELWQPNNNRQIEIFRETSVKSDKKTAHQYNPNSSDC